MKLEHLKSMLFQKNSKGRLREINIRPRPPKFAYASGGERQVHDKVLVRCSHCSNPITSVRNTSVVAATCPPCRERDRLVAIQAR